MLWINAYDVRSPSPNTSNGHMGAHILIGCSDAIFKAGYISLADGSWLMKYTKNSGTKTFKYQLNCGCSIDQTL